MIVIKYYREPRNSNPFIIAKKIISFTEKKKTLTNYEFYYYCIHFFSGTEFFFKISLDFKIIANKNLTIIIFFIEIQLNLVLRKKSTFFCFKNLNYEKKLFTINYFEYIHRK